MGSSERGTAPRTPDERERDDRVKRLLRKYDEAVREGNAELATASRIRDRLSAFGVDVEEVRIGSAVRALDEIMRVFANVTLNGESDKDLRIDLAYAIAESYRYGGSIKRISQLRERLRDA